MLFLTCHTVIGGHNNGDLYSSLRYLQLLKKLVPAVYILPNHKMCAIVYVKHNKIMLNQKQPALQIHKLYMFYYVQQMKYELPVLPVHHPNKYTILATKMYFVLCIVKLFSYAHFVASPFFQCLLFNGNQCTTQTQKNTLLLSCTLPIQYYYTLDIG